MTRKTLWTVLGIALGLLVAPLMAQAQPQVLKGAVTGSPELQSIEAINFGPNGVLLIGDGKGGQVVAIATGDTATKPWSKKEMPNIHEDIAGRLGTTGKNIQIIKMAVNPASQTAYLAVRMLNAKKDVIVTVDGDGKIAPLPLDKVQYVAVKLPSSEKSPVKLVTDINFADDRVLVAAQANETFASKIISIPTPLTHGATGAVFSSKTYHVAHKRWETNAPIRALFSYVDGGKNYAVGTFTCSPIVKYPLDELKVGAVVEGVSVIELGNGNTPKTMFPYEKNGKTYILVNSQRNAKFQNSNPVGPSPFWTAKVDINILNETDKVNEKAIWRAKGKASEDLTPFAVVVPEYHGVSHVARLGEQNALAIRTDDKGGMSLAVLALP